MAQYNVSDLKQQVVAASREQGISYTLFRNAIGKKLGLNTTDFEGLDLIFYRGVAAPSELSRYTGLSSGSTTAMIDRLEKAGLVKREANPNDRRGTLVVIDRSATHTFRPYFTAVRVAQNRLLDSYSREQLETLSDYFRRSAAMYEAERKHSSSPSAQK